ncbi:hypothetical protein C8J57DRAFT_1276715 [Mycena rebaudengoi]|nr:hypothetical protein C8J57DRAFT_1276715 [Mycena rebaudengoi]
MSSEAQIKSEIARLTATINQHKSANQNSTRPPGNAYQRGNSYVNPNYRPPNKYVRPSTSAIVKPPSFQSRPTAPAQVKEVVLNGRSLVRKDLPKPPSTTSAPPPPRPRHTAPRVYKPKTSRGRRGRGGPVNMTLNNSRRPYQSVSPLDASTLFSLISTTRSSRLAAKRLKYSDKPCPRFTTTGTCSRGLTCLYQHDPAKIAICWPFLHGTCPNTATTCDLSHDPTPERTPLCLHFLNKAAARAPPARVCRDFAVLGFCARGLDCDKQHVRECPDFAEKGACTTKGCKLPHVIRANRNRKPPPTATPAPVPTSAAADDLEAPLTADNAQLGDEFISLTFNESESSSSDDDDDSDDDEEEEDDSDQ